MAWNLFRPSVTMTLKLNIWHDRHQSTVNRISKLHLMALSTLLKKIDFIWRNYSCPDFVFISSFPWGLFKLNLKNNVHNHRKPEKVVYSQGSSLWKHCDDDLQNTLGKPVLSIKMLILNKNTEAEKSYSVSKWTVKNYGNFQLL